MLNGFLIFFFLLQLFYFYSWPKGWGENHFEGRCSSGGGNGDGDGNLCCL